MEIFYTCFADPDSIPLEVGIDFVGDSDSPSLVWANSDYSVAWANQSTPAGPYEIYIHRLGSGTMSQITTSDSLNMYPSLVWTGSEYGVAWQDDRSGGTRLYFTRVSADTTSKLVEDVAVDDGGGDAERPSLAWTGSGYGVAWQDSRHGDTEIYFARLDASGAKSGADVRITSAEGASERPSLIWNGDELAVAWHDGRNDNNEIYFARISAGGSKIGDDVRVTDDDGASEGVSLVWTGSEYAVAWHDDRDGAFAVYLAYLDANGNKSGEDRRISPSDSDARWPSLVSTDGIPALAWADESADEIHFAY
jgi:hypothetical protein